MKSESDISMGEPIRGIFNPAEIYSEEREEKDLFWEYHGTRVSLRDRNALKRLQNNLRNLEDWAGMKLINKVLLELDYTEKNTILSSMPVNLQIEHTNFCNARCIMCSHSFTRNHGARHMSEDELNIFDSVLPSVEKVTLHGMGEPFLHPRILDILETYHQYGVRVTCNTNASVMNPSLAKAVHRCFYDISVSCDGCTPHIYESIRKGLSFQTFLQNVRILRSAGDDLRMRLTAVAMRQNMEELPGIVRLASELGFQEVLFMDLTAQGLLRNERDCLPRYPAMAQRAIERALDEGAKYGIPVVVPDYILHTHTGHSLHEEQEMLRRIPAFQSEAFENKLYQRYKSAGFPETVIKATADNFVIPGRYHCMGICDFVLERPFINAKGDVFLCCTNWMHSIGNVYQDNGMEGVWNNSIMRGIRQLFYEGHIPKFCTGCIFLRNDVMCRRIHVTDFDQNFYRHNYDAMVNALILKAERGTGCVDGTAPI